jgi:RNA polymerase sigma-70 factor (ECF subfamily)
MSSTESPATTLLRRACAGDGEACGRLLDTYRGYLTLLARVQMGRRLQGKVEPSDIVQEVFMEAHRDFQQFHGQSEAELLAWLRRLLATSLTDQVRRYRGTQRRDLRLERQLALDLDESASALERGLAAPDSSPSERASRREETLQLAEAMERLPAGYRDVLLLRHFQGLAFADIAQRLGKSVDGVKHAWLRGLARLQRSLEKQP